MADSLAGAICAEIGPELFFFDSEEDGTKHVPGLEEKTARQLCAIKCPVRQACLKLAIEGPDSATYYGIWGGLSVRQLIWLRKQPVHGPERPPKEEKNVPDRLAQWPGGQGHGRAA